MNRLAVVIVFVAACMTYLALRSFTDSPKIEEVSAQQFEPFIEETLTLSGEQGSEALKKDLEATDFAHILEPLREIGERIVENNR